ncbi:MAG: S8 family serine peptidase, partial [Rubrivivax sp.]
MPRLIRFTPNSAVRFVSILLAYSLLLSLATPLIVRRAEAAPGVAKRKPSAATTPAARPTQQQETGRRAGELIVRFHDGVPEAAKNALAAGRGARRGKTLRGESRVEKLQLTTTSGDVAAAAAELRNNPEVEFAEPNYLINRDDVTPNDPRFAEQWALSNTGAGGGLPGSDLKLAEAWTQTTGAATTTVAIIDSGIDFTHPDLMHNEWTNTAERENGRDDDHDGFVDDLHGWDWVADSATIKDEQGHGTAIAGLVAAEGNNGVGISGVMWQASLMSLRVLDNTGTGDVAAAVEAIDYAAAHGAQVINLSWGTDGESLALKDAIARAAGRGVVVVCSAGNNGRDIDAAPYYPASYELPNLIAVAATDGFDQLTSWSNWGAVHVTIGAPGVDLLTTKLGGGYQMVTGTSGAAPLVSGIAGLVKTIAPGLSAANTRTAIINGARRVASLDGRMLASGVASAAGALAAVGSNGGGGNNGNGNGGGNGNNGNGGGNNGNGRGGQGGGSGPGRGPSPHPGTPGYGSGGRGSNGSFDVTPPEATRGAPRNLPNLDEARRLRNPNPQAPQPSSTISANLLCADCDPAGGGGGGYVPPGDPRYARARTEPSNETGQAGVDLGSRNFNWSTPLVGLKGRAGLDLGLALSYNSLVWTKQDYGIKFNADRGFPGPGFRLGFPTIQQRYYNSQVGVYAYMLVTPAGGRVELRQVGSSNVYEAQDRSYMQMIDYGDATALVRTTDGTQLNFGTSNGELRCYQIKDRNGNYLTINYDGYGHVNFVIDTLGRVINFNYNVDYNLTSITQLWNGATHTWATFTYGSLYLQGNFPGLSVNGPNYSYITVLTQVGLHDGSYYAFDYTSWGLVYRIRQHAADGHQRNYTSYNLPLDSSAGQSDCPRFTQRRDWAEEWNNGAEALTSYSVATDGSWSQVTMPDGTAYKEFFATAGWQTGLTTQTEAWSGGVRRKWTTNSWTQDDVNAGYPINPRVLEANIYDAENNRRRTTINYTSYSLPSEVREWGGANADQVLRRTVKDYRWDEPFISRRIIGLPSSDLVYEGESALLSKLEYHYDWANNFSGQAPSVQHDTANYGTSFAYGRGALVGVRRYNINAPDDPNQAVWPQVFGYDRAGSVVWTQDGSGHQTSISYADAYADGNNARNTLAYPTTVTDADWSSSSAQYNYDLGVVTRTQGPPAAGQAQGAIQTMQYDTAGRVERVTIQNSGAYTRWVYPASQDYVQSFSTVQSLQAESYAITYVDGAGRSRASAQGHPGSNGGYTATLTGYDVMGRTVQQTKPTEIYGSWMPAGDDAGGWVWTYQQYDWQGRPTLTTLPTGNTVENTYGGCGCAGGEVTTTRDERGRRKRYTKDTLGRLVKVEELSWDQSVYATTQYAYNARDQIASSNQAGQVRSFGYDGHGRLSSRTTPEQGLTTYAYNADDTTQSVQDARGATTAFTYNGRHLPTFIDYTAAGGAATTADVSFSYDAAGNRTGMTDGLGSQSYSYDQLSRLTAETRSFNGLGSYTLNYTYNPSGELTQVTNPWGAQVGYQYDVQGRTTGVSGAGYAGVTSYAGGVQYRAFGGLKAMTYGNGRTLALAYDNRMRLTTWNVPGVLGWNYRYDLIYENAGRVTYAQNLYDNSLDRSFEYDQVGRLLYSHSGVEARMHAYNQANDGGGYGPYAHHYGYDLWGNLNYRIGWGGANAQYNATYTNNRRDGLQYDAAGNVTNDGGQQFSYDAMGQQAYASGGGGITQSYDGDG